MKVLIVEDDKNTAKFISELLINNFHEINFHITFSNSVENAKNHLFKTKFDFLLLDIQINGGTTFDVLHEVNLKDCPFIFITAYDHLAIRALKIGALDYILKPIDLNEFKEAIFKILNHNKVGDFASQFKVAKDILDKKPNKFIAIPTNSAIHIVELEDVLYCKSDGNYTTFYMKNEDRLVMSKPLKYVIKLLPSYFVKIHQSYVVQLQAISKYLKIGGVILKSGKELPVSSRYKKETQDRLMKGY
ncbi:LytR/AlgR family response regulator transcription factor [Nonlabens sp. SY33080]|uniref:LytR/AlgR family response regulator transcription factor n=1 Tax=Nonlabens sp. SY33080 TaxID=2719911 RepID=UPI001428B7B6|nr:LytTR family DNA-binding domain-containing protein [Nonlabens sp. SY33080]